jgi:hypothetical protein
MPRHNADKPKKNLRRARDKRDERRADFDKSPPKSKGSVQQHGLNKNGNPAKRPGSMKR